MNYLRQQPYMFAAPMIGWLEQREQQARMEAAKAEPAPNEK